MNEQLQALVNLFAANVASIKRDFIWQSTSIKRLAALLYAAEGKEIDCDAVHDCHSMIKENTGIFSVFRGNSAITVATLISLKSSRDQLLKNTLDVYDMMRKAKFRALDHLVVAAYQIAANAAPHEFQGTVDRTRAFYDGMKEEHRFITGYDDYMFAAQLGLSRIPLEAGLRNMEAFYEALRPELRFRNGVQALSHVLVLGEMPPDSVGRVLALRDSLRNIGLRLDREYSVSSLGILALLPGSTDEIVTELSETYELLRGGKGFSAWTVSKQELLIISAALVAFGRTNGRNNEIVTVAATSITSILIAQQIAVAAAASSSAAAAAASS
jgi:hypothetical protein